jgi:hypothetical protein
VKLFIRAFADCENREAAGGIAARIALVLSHLSPAASSEPSRYWKLPHLFEFTFVLTPPTETSFREIVAASHGGWSHSGAGSELSSVWNRDPGNSFLVPEVSWAEVQLYEPAP